jgi:hypothetical protein
MSGRTIVELGRPKAYRPLPMATRADALSAGLAAYDRGDWFLAHELLEPAWMGASDPRERALHSGLIKLAAAGVHGARGNPGGLFKNLTGARLRFAALVPADAESTTKSLEMAGLPAADDIDLPALLAAVDARLDAERSQPTTADPPPIPRRS